MKKFLIALLVFFLLLGILPKRLLEIFLLPIATFAVNFSYLFSYIGLPSEALRLFSFIVFLLMLYLIIELGIYIYESFSKKNKKRSKKLSKIDNK